MIPHKRGPEARRLKADKTRMMKKPKNERAFQISHMFIDVKSQYDYVENLYLCFAVKYNENNMASKGCCPKIVLLWDTLSTKKTTMMIL